MYVSLASVCRLELLSWAVDECRAVDKLCSLPSGYFQLQRRDCLPAVCNWTVLDHQLVDLPCLPCRTVYSADWTGRVQ